MPYIDANYYLNTFKGVQPPAGMDIDMLIERASDVVDMISDFKIQRFNVDIESTSFNSFIRDNIKKATASQVQYFILEGGFEEIFANNNTLSQVNLGGFSYTDSSGKLQQKSITNPATINFLSVTGLLYAGLDRRWLCFSFVDPTFNGVYYEG